MKEKGEEGGGYYYFFLLMDIYPLCSAHKISSPGLGNLGFCTLPPILERFVDALSRGFAGMT